MISSSMRDGELGRQYIHCTVLLLVVFYGLGLGLSPFSLTLSPFQNTLYYNGAGYEGCVYYLLCRLAHVPVQLPA